MEAIKIGVSADLNNFYGKAAWQGAVLAAEQINAAGGVLGRNFTIVAEDDDDEAQPLDIQVASNAFTKLITVDNADYTLTPGLGATVVFEDIAAEHKKILIDIGAVDDVLTQRVVSNYNKYRYFFRAGLANASSGIIGMADSISTLRNYTGFTKVAFLVEDIPVFKQMASGVSTLLPKYGLNIVYNGVVPPGTVDFTSYFAAIEASGAEILIPIIVSQASVSFVKEWYERQSPVVVWGYLTSTMSGNFWELTEGKCESITFLGIPITTGYPFTSKTVPTREALIARWGDIGALATAGHAYDFVRFILSDAIKRAGTTETEAVIKALETTNVETSSARHFVFTSSHDVLVGATSPNGSEEDYTLVCMFQWQNKTQVPVYPMKIKEEAGATYEYPPWHGAWSNTSTP
jgi:branched-chain amino acid transport system substrate-binding protein